MYTYVCECVSLGGTGLSETPGKVDPDSKVTPNRNGLVFDSWCHPHSHSNSPVLVNSGFKGLNGCFTVQSSKDIRPLIG